MNSIQLELQPIQKGQHAFLFFEKVPSQETQSIICGICSEKIWAMDLKIGAVLKKNGIPSLKVVSKHFMPFSVLPVYVLLCLNSINGMQKILEEDKANTVSSFQTHCFEYTKDSYSLAIITLSDKGFVGKRIDESGPTIAKLITEKIAFSEERSFILPDDATALKGLIASLAYNQAFDCIVTTGGTGLSERDITPNALLPMLDQRLHGFEHAMMQASLEKTPTAMLSRAFCGIINKSIIISVPGSVKASVENIEAILPALPHALAKLQGDMSDCGRK